MCSGSRCPGSVRGDSVPEFTMSRGDASILYEPPNQSSVLGLWALKRESVRLEVETTRTRLANRALAILGIFILAGIGSITWVTLSGKSATELGICIEIIATPLFGLVMLVVGYYYGHSNKAPVRQHVCNPMTDQGGTATD
jgi:hypothetical protein